MTHQSDLPSMEGRSFNLESTVKLLSLRYAPTLPYISLTKTSLTAFCYSIKSAKEDTASHKVFRWLMDIAQYPCDIIHVQGKDNVIADALSRTPFVPPVEEKNARNP